MCTSMDKKYMEKEVTGAINGMKMMGASDNDIIKKIIENYKVKKEYVLELLSLQKV